MIKRLNCSGLRDKEIYKRILFYLDENYKKIILETIDYKTYYKQGKDMIAKELNKESLDEIRKLIYGKKVKYVWFIDNYN